MTNGEAWNRHPACYFSAPKHGCVHPHTPHARLWPLRFVSVEALSGLVLLAAAALALGWANSSLAPGYEALWHLPLGLGVARYLPAHDLHFWVNDGLMTLFFLVVGLEIRRELHDGSLVGSEGRHAADPGRRRAASSCRRSSTCS